MIKKFKTLQGYNINLIQKKTITKTIFKEFQITVTYNCIGTNLKLRISIKKNTVLYRAATVCYMYVNRYMLRYL